MKEFKIYLDNCTYHRPYDDQRNIRISLEAQAKLYIQKLVVDHRLLLVCSYINRYENARCPQIEHRTSIEKFFHNAKVFVDSDKSEVVERRANEIMKFKIKANDAIHLSCAIEGGCDYFITTDDGILKKYKSFDVTVCSPIEFLKLLER